MDGASVQIVVVIGGLLKEEGEHLIIIDEMQRNWIKKENNSYH